MSQEGENQIRIVVQDVERVTETIVKQLTVNLTAKLAERTPRDTGWAANNWVPSIGDPFVGLAGSRDAVTSSYQEAGIVTVASGYRLAMGPCWVSNNVPYIGPLNNGSSEKAPAGFVQTALLETVEEEIRVEER